MLASDSDRGLQLIIGAALIDDRILTALIDHPLMVADDYRLTIPERRFLVSTPALDLEHFAAGVERGRRRVLTSPNSADFVIEMI
jgi:hypothetical protein